MRLMQQTTFLGWGAVVWQTQPSPRAKTTTASDLAACRGK
jgi:hypothetical protein